MKKLLSVLLFALLLCSAVGLSACGMIKNENYVHEEPTPDEYFTFTLLDNDTYEIKAKDVHNMPAKVVLPSTYNGKAVTSIGEFAFLDYEGYQNNIKDIKTEDDMFAYTCNDLTEIIIPNNIKYIRGNAFIACINLTNITFGKSSKLESIGDYAFSHCWALEEIIIPYTVTSIGKYAFCQCISFTSIIIPNNVTSIGDYAFYDCFKLVEVINKSGLTITEGRYANGRVGAYALTVHNGESKIVNKDGYLFITHDETNYLLGYLGTETDLILPESYDGQNYQIYNAAFCERRNLTSIAIPDIVTSIGIDCFYDCRSLKRIMIGDSVTSIGDSAFRNCDNLTSVTIGDSVTSIKTYAFSGCSRLTTVYYKGTAEEWHNISIGSSNGNLTGATRYYYSEEYPTEFAADTYWHYVDGVPTVWAVTSDEYFTFTLLDNDTYEIKAKDKNNIPAEVILPSTYNSKAVTSIGNSAFFMCSSLTSITIHDGVTSIGSQAFRGCSRLTCITVDKNNENYKSIDGNLYNKDATLLIQYAIGKTATEFTIPDSVTSIGGEAFRVCSSLTSINIPDSVTSIGYSAFEFCGRLSEITIPDSVTSIGNDAFDYCSSLTSITIPDSVTYIGRSAFPSHLRETENGLIYVDKALIGTASTSGLPQTSYTVKEGTTVIAGGAFSGNSYVKTINLPASLKGIYSYAFNNCSSLTNIYYTGTASEWASIDRFDNIMSSSIPLYIDNKPLTNVVLENITEIKAYAFSKCSSLSEITIPDSVTSIGSGAFEDCSSLTSITIPDSVTSIGNGAFSGCSSLTSVTIPDSVTSIGGGAFYNCSSLSEITIPDSITSIGNQAFRGCSSLSEITIPDSVTSIGSSAFRYCSNLTTVYYKGTAEEWGNISIGLYNSALTYATRYYYSEGYPENFVADTYWHYVDCEIVIWEETPIDSEYTPWIT